MLLARFQHKACVCLVQGWRVHVVHILGCCSGLLCLFGGLVPC